MAMSARKLVYGLFLLVILGLFVYAFFIEPNSLVVNNYRLTLSKWTPKLNGFKIVAISDIHAGSNFIDEEKLREIVATANAEDADIIVLLGDYVSRSYLPAAGLRMPVSKIAENLTGFKAKHGVFAVLGNHDNEFNSQIIRKELDKAGIKVLENEIVSIAKDGEKLRIFGINDILKLGGNWSEGSAELKKRLEHSGDSEGQIIVLTHNPDVIAYLTEERSISGELSLILAGHTHGGQCRFPLIGSPVVPSSFGQRYARGHIHDKGTDMFVTTGIGTSILPIRFGVPPEISVLQIW